MKLAIVFMTLITIPNCVWEIKQALPNVLVI